VVKFIDAIAEKTLRVTVTMMAARGRGKSAALGLAIAGAVAMGLVTGPLTNSGGADICSLAFDQTPAYAALRVFLSTSWLLLVLIVPSHGGMARLSYQSGFYIQM